jgi:hypothetical protein
LSEGSYWVYEYRAYGGENEATYVVTDTVETAEWQGADYVAQMLRQTSYLTGVPGLINEPPPERYWYIVHQNQLYRQRELDLEAVERSWLEYLYPPPLFWFPDPADRARDDLMGSGRVRFPAEDLQVPAGLFTNCSQIATHYLGGSPQLWHCPGVGIVKETYDHRGTPFGYEMVLVDWEIGD